MGRIYAVPFVVLAVVFASKPASALTQDAQLARVASCLHWGAGAADDLESYGIDYSVVGKPAGLKLLGWHKVVVSASGACASVGSIQDPAEAESAVKAVTYGSRTLSSGHSVFEIGKAADGSRTYAAY